MKLYLELKQEGRAVYVSQSAVKKHNQTTDHFRQSTEYINQYTEYLVLRAVARS